MSVLRVVVALLGLAACAPRNLVGPPTVEATPALVVVLEGEVLRACQVHLGWGPDQVISECGEPERRVKWAAGGRCFIYRTSSHTFQGERGAPMHAVCLDVRRYEFQPEREKPTAPRPTVQEARGEFVLAVFPMVEELPAPAVEPEPQ